MPNETEVQSERPETTMIPGSATRTADRDGLTMLDLMLILTARKRLIGALTMAGAALAAAIAFWLPNRYTATAVILPPQQGMSTAAMLLGQLGSISGGAASQFGLKSPADLYVGLLGSRTIADHLVHRFGLVNVYHSRTVTDARNALQKHRKFSAGADSLIKIEVDDADPRRASDLANAYVSELTDKNNGFAASDGAQRRIFLERRLEEEKNTLAAAEEAMKATEARTGLVQVDAQAHVTLGSIAQLRAQIAAGEVALERLKMGATRRNPEVVRTEVELDALRAQLATLQRAHPRNGDDAVISAGNLPQTSLEYMRSLRDLKYHEFLFELLSKQYEAARIDERKEAPIIQVVDRAAPPERKSGPHRAIIILLSALASAAVAGTIAYLLHAVANPRDRQKLRLLRSNLVGAH